MEANFQVGKPVSGIEFIGRQAEAKQLFELLKSGQSVVLIAPRRYGKTSLILRTLDMLMQASCCTASIDIFSIPNVKRLSEEFTSKILENRKLEKVIQLAKKNVSELFKNIELKSTVDDFEFVLKFGQNNTDEWELLENSIDFAEKFAQKFNTQLVVALDEFGDIEKLGADNIAKMLRAKMQVQKKVSYIFSGSYESVMANLFTTAKSPFYRFARIVHLGNINIKDFEQLYINKLTAANIPVNAKLISKILSFTKGHPYYSSLFLQIWLHNNKPLSENNNTNFNIFITQVLDSECSYLEKLWEDVSSSREQRTLLLSLAESSKPYTGAEVLRINISRSIHGLINKGYVCKTKAGYIFTDPIFEVWIKKVVLKE